MIQSLALPFWLLERMFSLIIGFRLRFGDEESPVLFHSEWAFSAHRLLVQQQESLSLDTGLRPLLTQDRNGWHRLVGRSGVRSQATGHRDESDVVSSVASSLSLLPQTQTQRRLVTMSHNTRVPNTRVVHVLLSQVMTIAHTDDMQQEDEPMDTGETPATPGPAFQVIGEVIATKLQPVKPPVADWVRSAESFSSSLSKPTDRTDLSVLQPLVSQATIDKLKKNGIDSLFPVQTCLIPYLMRSLRASATVRPRDVCVSSPTGSGKTLAFVIPIVEYLKRHLISRLRAVIVVPAGGLGEQIMTVFQKYTSGTPVKVFCSTGKSSILSKDMQHLSRVQFDVLIVTPGRLHELMTNLPELDLTGVQILVMDEADRLDSNEMDRNWLSDFETAVDPDRRLSCPCGDPSGRTKMVTSYTTACSVMSYTGFKKSLVKWLFSATLSPDSVDTMRLFRPKLFTAAQDPGSGHDNEFVIPAELTEKIIPVKESQKPLFVAYLMLVMKYKRVMCFTESVESTHRLCLLLRRFPGIKAGEFSSSQTFKHRTEKLEQFRNGVIEILICTDIMARGLDFDDVEVVLNYDIPRTKSAYVHRIGRTARVGKSGTALTLIDLKSRDFKLFKRVWKQTHGPGHTIPELKISDDDLKPYEQQYETALSGLEKAVEKEKFSARNARRKIVQQSASNKN